ncbi:MAG: hypothetical protein JWR77_904 [Rhizorhabdus sp.]|nr:hypothetical protein [Rhizorhabdus sp.]
MTRPTRFCRVAWIVDDMDATVAALNRHLGLTMRFGTIATDVIKAGIEEHGLEPIQLFVPSSQLPFMAGLPEPLVEIALAVDDCEVSKARLAKGGLHPSFTSPLPGPDTQEHLYAHGFHGLPVMVCTDGDNESMMAPFRDLEEAPVPKIGVITMGVDSIDAVAPLFTRYFDMEWAETDPAGFGVRAVSGRHRVKLVEKPNAALASHYMNCLLTTEMMFENPDEIHARIEAAGIPLVATRTFSSGRKSRFYGKAIAGVPLSIYDVRDEDEARGLA